MNSPFYATVCVVGKGVVRLPIGVLLFLLDQASKSFPRFLLVSVAVAAGTWYLSATVVPFCLAWVTLTLERQPLGLPLLVLEALVALFFFGSWLMVFTHPEHPVASRVIRAIGTCCQFGAGSLLLALVMGAGLFAIGATLVGEYYLVGAMTRLGKEPFFLVTIGVISAWFFAWLPIHQAIQPEPVLDAERIKRLCASCRDFDPRPYFDDEEVFVGREV